MLSFLKKSLTVYTVFLLCFLNVLTPVYSVPLWALFSKEEVSVSNFPIEFVEATGNNFASTRSPLVNYPTAVANDVWLAVFACTGASNYTGTPPSGWTKLHELDGPSSFDSGAVFWKRADGTEGANQTWTDITDITENGIVIVLAYRNCITSGSPINASATPKSTGSATAQDSNTITTTEDNCMIVGIICIDPGAYPRTFAWDAPIDERIDQTTTPTGQNSTIAGIHVGEKILSTAGATTMGGDFDGAESGSIFVYALQQQ